VLNVDPKLSKTELLIERPIGRTITMLLVKISRSMRQTRYKLPHDASNVTSSRALEHSELTIDNCQTLQVVPMQHRLRVDGVNPKALSGWCRS